LYSWFLGASGAYGSGKINWRPETSNGYYDASATKNIGNEMKNFNFRGDTDAGMEMNLVAGGTAAGQLAAIRIQVPAAGEYDVALADYEAILNQGKYSAVLYYNLANTYFKLDQLGKAILYYNRALRLSPTDEDIRHNLEYAEQMTKDSIEEIPEFVLTTWMKAVRGVCSATAWTIISLVMLVLALSMALVYLLAHRLSLRKTGFYVMAVAGLLFIVTTLFALSEREQVVDSREAIVMNSAVSIKSSPDRAAVELFVLHEGTKVYIGSEMAGWAEVRIADGRKGWIEINRIENI
jgi:tetratricopeptide (TPR) repeat protein